jgi:hypothetical protein
MGRGKKNVTEHERLEEEKEARRVGSQEESL